MISLEFEKSSVAYKGLDNPITIIVEGILCKNLWLTASNGVSVIGSGCHRIIRCRNLGEANLNIYKIEGRDTALVGIKKIRIKELPDQIPFLGKINKGIMGDGELRAQQGVTIPILGFDIDARCEVQSFKLSLMRKGELIASSDNLGGVFGNESKLVLQKAKSGDQVLIDEIKVRYPGEQIAREAKDIKISIR